MNLSEYINDLLYRYDCVIIPNFGGFVTNKIGAKINEITHIFYPPTKQITFNSYLKHNDGLLANHISASENISFEQANIFIAKEVEKWNTELTTKSIEILKIGTLFLNDEKQVSFEPEIDANFLTESFGLAGVPVELIEQKNPLEELLVSEEQPDIEVSSDKVLIEEQKEVRKIPVFIKYAAASAILITLGSVGFRAYQQNRTKVYLAKEQEKLEDRIQKATFVIDNPLPTVNLSVPKIEKQKEESNSYHIIAGAFRSKENANKKVSQLQEQGFKASVVGENKWGLFQVAYESFPTNEEGKQALRKIRKTTNNKAWMLVKTLQ